MAENTLTQQPLNEGGVQYSGTTPTAPNGGAEMNYGIVNSEIPDFFTTSYDRNIVKHGWATTPINTITRKIGFKQTKSMSYGYWSLGMRESSDALAEAVTFDTEGAMYNASGVKNAEVGLVTLKVKNAKRFDKTDQITFVSVPGVGLDPATNTNKEIPYMPLNALVVDHDKTKNSTITVKFLNNMAGKTIPVDTEIIILGHAVAEADGRVAPHAANPTPTTQHMQKFMTSASVTNVWIESEKQANYGLGDLIDMNNQQFIEDTEKTYIWSVRQSVVDEESGTNTWTTAGLIQQMLEGGSKLIELKASTMTDGSIMDMMTDVFIGNTGSTSRYFFTGSELFKAFLKQKDIAKQVHHTDPVRKFEYDWARIRFGAYSLLQTPHPLFDKFKQYSGLGLILDLQYVERHVFRAMTEDQLDMMKIGVKDAKDIRCCEISSILLKYAQCHALVMYTDDVATGAAA
jgi:hypothetical protein